MEVPQLTLRFAFEKINKKKVFVTKVFEVRGLEWQIKMVKRQEGLGVYLESRREDTSTDWSCMAWCRVQLISLCRQPYEKSFQAPREFTAKRLSHGFKNFISLNDLYDPAKSYVDNHSIVLEVKVKANLPVILSKSLMEKSTVIRLKIDNINDSCGFISPVTDVCDMPWRVKVYTRKIDKEKVIAIMLSCAYDGCDDTKTWSCKASATFRLQSFDPGQQPHEWKFSKKHKFSQKSASHGCRNFITWNELLDEDKEFVQNGSIKFEIEMIVEKPIGIRAKKTVDCPICLENLQERSVRTTECGHIFCQYCIERSVNTRNVCPTCNNPLLPSEIYTIFLP